MEGVYTESQLDEMHAMTEEDDDDDVIQLDGELFFINLCYEGGNISRMILLPLFYHLLKVVLYIADCIICVVDDSLFCFSITYPW